MFFIHGCVSFVAAKLAGIEGTLDDDDSTTSISSGDPGLKYFGPSAKFGFVYHM